MCAISVGIYKNNIVLDLDYDEDSQADTDMNVVMTETGEFIEIQGSAEQGCFTADQLNQLLQLAQKAGRDITTLQKEALK